MALVPTNENNGLTVGVGLLPLKTTNPGAMTPLAAVRQPAYSWIATFNSDMSCTLRSAFDQDVALSHGDAESTQLFLQRKNGDLSGVPGYNFKFVDGYNLGQLSTR